MIIMIIDKVTNAANYEQEWKGGKNPQFKNEIKMNKTVNDTILSSYNPSNLVNIRNTLVK